MPQAPDLTDAEIGELDDLLAAVPAPLQALDVVMLDGYLCGVLAQPEIVPPEAWMPPAFDWNLGDGDSGAVLSPDTPGWHAAKHERLTTLTLRRHAHLAAVMTDPGWFDPIVMTPADDQGRPLPAKAAIEAALGPWVIGFEHALNHFTGLEEVPALEVADLLACVRRHLPDQDEEEQAETAALDQEHPLKSLDAAIEDLVGNVIELADLARAERVKVVTVRREAPKVGRNDPCPCGSGRKFKQCHGRSEGGAAPDGGAPGPRPPPMRLQLLSDLHLETEAFEPRPAPSAELLVLAGDIDASWQGLERFARWPVPVILVAGNHEFDRRELDTAWPALRAVCTDLGIRLLQREAVTLKDRGGRAVRFLGTVRWSDFDLYGPARRERSLRAGRYFQAVMAATRGGRPFDAEAVREEGLACRAWLAQALRPDLDPATTGPRPSDVEPSALPSATEPPPDATVVITHFAPSLRSADPRYGAQPGTASFCNADDDLLPAANLWVHGHLHCRHDYGHAHAGGVTRVVCNARGHGPRGESDGYDGLLCVEV